jgi:intein/homing endonuclease
MIVVERFVLNPETKALLYSMEPEFGYGEYGKFVYYRTYSRVKKDGTQEHWADTVIRVIEGVMSIRKDWYVKTRVHWDEEQWQRIASGMALSLFKMQWLPPGRGLWAMGSDFVYERGGMALYNCAYTELGQDYPRDLEWLMDSLMHGVGVGFRPIRDDTLLLRVPEGRYSYVIGDTRESWCESVRALLKAYRNGSSQPVFDYSAIRPRGLPIRGFGGVASGPEPLIELHKQIIELSERYIRSQDLYSEDSYDSVMYLTDLANLIGCCVVAGNVRRSAEIALGSLSDPVFADLKNYDRYPYRAGHGWMSNNSVTLVDDEDFESLGEIAERVKRNGEPGYINLRNFKYGRIGKDDFLPLDHATGINPCITGDTKVMIADGRGFVPIDSLLGTDVDVYCINDKDEVVIRRMRNPRITGHKVKILKVTFDSGDSIRITENHKFMLRDRTFKEAKDLTFGDQLAVVNRYIPIECEGESYWDKYIGIGYSGNISAEHRIIGEHKYGPLGNSHIHHIDKDKLNNSPENLELKDANDHLSDHSQGIDNPNWGGLTNEELLQAGINLCQKSGRRFSKKEWQSLGPIKSFSDFRKSRFGSITVFAYHCADMAGVKNEAVDPRTLRFLIDVLKQGYEAEIVGDTVFVTKTCEACKKDFEIEATRREQGCCGHSCANTLRDYTKASNTFRETHAKKKEGIREQQLDIYTQLRQQLGCIPKKKEWITACKEQGVSPEISRASSPFRDYSELQWAARSHNHRVVSVVEDGYENVYNGTVDDYHNFIVGGWEEMTPFGRLVQRGIVNPQCGEIPLENKEVCNLAETLPTRCESDEQWYDACQYATIYSSAVSLLPTHQPETNRVVARNRRIGVGIIDFTGWKHQIGLHQVTRRLREGYRIVRETNGFLSAEAGVPAAIRVTTVKPGGTTPKLAGRTSGAGYPTFIFTLRRTRVAEGSNIASILMKAGVPYEKDVVSKGTLVFEMPIKQGPAKPASDVTLWEQAMNLQLLQREWSDNAVSNTLYFKPKWVLVELIEDNHWERLLLHVANPAKILESENEVFVFPEQKIIKQGNNVLVFEYNPAHEEDDIEAVLSAIAPMTKSVSLLPHTPNGVYPQMPEEGISENEYFSRLSEIKTIDWSLLKNSDGEDELYCSGGACELPNL